LTLSTTAVSKVSVTQQGNSYNMHVAFTTNLPQGSTFQFYLATLASDMQDGTNYGPNPHWILDQTTYIATAGLNNDIDVTKFQYGAALYMAIVSDLQQGTAQMQGVFRSYGIEPCSPCDTTGHALLDQLKQGDGLIPSPQVTIPPLGI
jgi:hypothetical protein